MKRLVVLMVVLFVGFTAVSTVQADPRASGQKLVEFFKTYKHIRGVTHTCPITDSELREIIEAIHVLEEGETSLQMALMLGISLGCDFMMGKTQTAASPTQPAFILPDYDTFAYCKNVAQISGGSYAVESGCIELEHAAMNKLGTMTIPEETVNYCNRLAQTSGGSYLILQGCVEMEIQARQRLGR